MTIAHLKILLANRQPHEIQAGVRYTILEKAVAEFEAMCDRVCASPEPARDPVDETRHLRDRDLVAHLREREADKLLHSTCAIVKGLAKTPPIDERVLFAEADAERERILRGA